MDCKCTVKSNQGQDISHYTECKDSLPFKKIGIDDIQIIRGFLKEQPFGICDFTVGGLYMWTEYFNYEYCVAGGTLFIKGDDVLAEGKTSFALPVGAMPFSEALELLKRYADGRNEELSLSEIPEDFLSYVDGAEITELADWGDYMYLAEDLATLTGHRYNKKRNKVNIFKKENEDYLYKPLTEETIPQILSFLDGFEKRSDDKSSMAVYEIIQTRRILESYGIWDFVGGVLYAGGEIKAFTVGEIIKDILYVHIEKADIGSDGAYQMINYLFAGDMTRSYGVKYINREEDVGDLGLRQSKLSYQPLRIIKKFKAVIK
ncbi:MAG: phosphatidylglycerol lysyltransferase domain-containing protein [Clostridiales bacterium]|jgi:hypothetical protein|nr:phosphatidylglycerol lysyltransferase domain-containing protein [Clostridiales bacterium]